MKTLSTLLIQNLQKGSRYLADLLEKESVEAWEERKRKARVLGDTAATKTASSDGLNAPGGDGGDHAAGMPFLLRRVELKNRERKCEVTNENMWKYVKEFAMEEDAVGVVEIILILVVLISLVIIFKEQLTALV